MLTFVYSEAVQVCRAMYARSTAGHSRESTTCVRIPNRSIYIIQRHALASQLKYQRRSSDISAIAESMAERTKIRTYYGGND